MIKLAIVDDESLVRVGFQTIMDWNAHGYDIMGVFRNGREAWESFTQEGYPDVLLTDIRMPEMDGLELIRRIRQYDKEMIILVLSSYDEFEYTRRAIQLGVQDYILKHLFDPQELLELLTRLTESKRHDVKAHAVKTRVDRLDEERQRLMTQSRMLPGIVGSTQELALQDYPVLCELLGQSRSLCWLSIRIWSTEHTETSESDRTALGFLLQDLMDKTAQALPLGFDQGVFHGLLYSSEDAADAERLPLLTGLVRQWMETIKQNLAVTIVAGLSGTGSFSNCKNMRQQALRMLDRSFYNGPGLYHDEGQTIPPPDKLEAQLQQWQQQFIVLLKSGSQSEFMNWLDAVGLELSQACSPDLAFRLVQWMLMSYQDELHRDSLETHPRSKPLAVSVLSANDYRTWKDLKAAVIEHMDCSGAAWRTNFKGPAWLQPVFSYVEEHYGDVIRLEDAAGLVNLNNHYFSHRFSQEMSQTFLEYVTSVRISKSMELMKQFQLSAEEVASRVGYPNANYFVKVFKKVTGVTVSEFKSSLTQIKLKEWNPSSKNRMKSNHME